MNFATFTTIEVPFDKDATITPLGPIDGAGVQAAIAALLPGIDDLIVISHGWNNDVVDARGLYTAFFTSVAQAWSAAGLTAADQQRTGVIALYWPSKKFDEADLIPGGAAAIDDAAATDYGAAIAAQIANLKDANGQFDPAQQQALDTALQQVPSLEGEAAQNAYVAALASLFPSASGEADPGLDASKGGFAGRSGADILNDIETQLGAQAPAAAAGGGAAVIGDDAPSGDGGRRNGARLRSDRRRQARGESAPESDDVLRDERARGDGRAKRRGAARRGGAGGEAVAARAPRRAQLRRTARHLARERAAGRRAGPHDLAAPGGVFALRPRAGAARRKPPRRRVPRRHREE